MITFDIFSKMSQFTQPLHRLWKAEFEPNEDYDHDKYVSRVEVSDENEANAVSSELAGDGRGTHTVMVDIDLPAQLIRSSTEGHYHLYVDIPPVSWEKYEAWLKASVEIGLIEEGYQRASSERKATFLRVPWVKK